MSGPPLRVLIADDHAPTRSGVRRALESGGITVCGEAKDAGSAVVVAAATRPDIVLLDIRMPGSGIRAARDIADQLPNTAIVMLTVSRSDEDLFDALKAGASGYLMKDTDPSRLPSTLECVVNGEAALSRTLVAKLIEEFRRRSGRRRLSVLGRGTARLTEREWEVLDLLQDGLSTSDIARRLYISDVTVRSHVSAIIKKLNVDSRAAAVRLVSQD